MRKLLISAALVTAAAVTAPASAQYRDYDRQGYGFNHGAQIPQQLAQIADRIERARERRLISRNEARQLMNQVERIDDRYDDYRRGGLTRWEHQDLQQRIQNLRQRLRWERREGREERWDDRRDRY
jgi:hypothetical protein